MAGDEAAPSGGVIYEEVRKLLDRKQSAARAEGLRADPFDRYVRTPVRTAWRVIDRTGERIAGWLTSPMTVSMAGLLALVFAAASVFLMYAPPAETFSNVPASDPGTGASIPPTSPNSEPWEPAPEPAATIDTDPVASGEAERSGSGDIDDPDPAVGEVEEEPGRPQPEAWAPGEADSYLIRVGSFRNRANAERVVESLRDQAPDVRTESTASGIHAVMIGPFSERRDAEDAARWVGESTDLRPQVLHIASERLPR